jgi:2-dehydro-3-deoxyphosphogluconate aldolase/(4S)-4-hydroxy-2-oxoglutarate aldolase
MFDEELAERLARCGVVAVLTVESAREAVPLARALLKGGVGAMELTLRTADAVDAVRAVVAEVPQMLAGVGTILRPAQVAEVKQAGAAFGVAPGTNPEVVQEAQRQGLPFAPGVATPSEVERAVALGCRVLKFFPAEPMGGLSYLRSMATPFAHLGLRFVPLGGLNAGNVGAYLRDQIILAVGGSWVAPRGRIADHDWPGITELAMEASELAREAGRPGAGEGPSEGDAPSTPGTAGRERHG